jgi:hypothetical protein
VSECREWISERGDGRARRWCGMVVVCAGGQVENGRGGGGWSFLRPPPRGGGGGGVHNNKRPVFCLKHFCLFQACLWGGVGGGRVGCWRCIIWQTGTQLLVRTADCRSAGPWFKSRCALYLLKISPSVGAVGRAGRGGGRRWWKRLPSTRLPMEWFEAQAVSRYHPLPLPNMRMIDAIGRKCAIE